MDTFLKESLKCHYMLIASQFKDVHWKVGSDHIAGYTWMWVTGPYVTVAICWTLAEFLQFLVWISLKPTRFTTKRNAITLLLSNSYIVIIKKDGIQGLGLPGVSAH